MAKPKADTGRPIDDCLFIGMHVEWHYILAAYVDTRYSTPSRLVNTSGFFGGFQHRIFYLYSDEP